MVSEKEYDREDQRILMRSFLIDKIAQYFTGT